MAKIVWTAGALQDLDEIAEYIARDNPAAANRLVRRVFDRTDLLESFPEMGRYVPEFAARTHRQLVIRPCRVVYKLEKDTVFVDMVIRGERLLTEQMIKERYF